MKGQKDFKAFDLSVNIGGDISSAIFLIVLTILSKNSKIIIKYVNLNPIQEQEQYFLF